MDKLARIQKINQLLAAAGGKVTGRKKLHKLAYLCQEAGTDLGQSFVFHFYGVYSPGLADDLNLAERWKEITETPEGLSYVIELNPELHPGKETDFSGGLKVAQALAGEEPAVLEVLSTIVYLDRHDFSGQNLVGKLEDLKGHLKRYFDRSLQLASQHYRIIR